MIDNIQSISHNIEEIEVIEEKTENMAKTAEDFAGNANTLERTMYYRNMKMNIVIGLLIGGILLYVVLPIFT